MRAGLIVIVLAGCSENGLNLLTESVEAPIPLIDVRPSRLDFGAVDAGQDATLRFTVRNVGGAELRVDGLALDDASFALVDPSPFRLAPEEAREVEVVFAPLEPDEVRGRADVASNDPDRAVVPVELVGRGNVPRLRIEPEVWDFGARPFGCETDVTLVLQNVGNMDLVLDAATYAGDGQLDVVDPEALAGLVLAPREWTTTSVRYVPAVEGPVDGALAIVSNDPNGPGIADQRGLSEPGRSYADTFTTPLDPPVDLLFAVDQSCSMDDDAARLAASFSAFIAGVETVTSGWHLGVVTMDDGCFNGGVLTSGAAGLEATFADAVARGTDGEVLNDEALLRLVDLALRETAPSGCNEGFLRAGAPLHVVVVSDEPEQSTAIAAAWTWDYWLERHRAYVAADPLLQVSGVVDKDGCSDGDAGYAEVIAATGGARLSICTTDWAAHVASLAAVSTGRAYTFELSEPAVAATVRVSVDGRAWETGWSYIEAMNAVAFPWLEPGSRVDVTYGARSECPRDP